MIWVLILVVVVSHCGCNLHFSNDYVIFSVFSCAICHLYVLVKCIYESVACFSSWGCFFILILNSKSSSHILVVSVLPNLCVMNIFSHSADYLLIFLTMSFFNEQSVLTLIKSPIYQYSHLWLGLWSKKTLPTLHHKKFLLVPLKCFIVLAFVFKSMDTS